MPVRITVAEAARLADLTVHQLRTFKNAGLLKPCITTPEGDFIVGEPCVARLQLIGAAARAGLYPRHIADLVRALDQGVLNTAPMAATGTDKRTCSICHKEISLDIGFSPEADKYVTHFCSIECYACFVAREREAGNAPEDGDVDD